MRESEQGMSDGGGEGDGEREIEHKAFFLLHFKYSSAILFAFVVY